VASHKRPRQSDWEIERPGDSLVRLSVSTGLGRQVLLGIMIQQIR
jgi:hypothetical protein